MTQQPNNPGMETAVLGGVLLDPSCLVDIAAILSPEDFFLERNQVIFSEMLLLHSRSLPPELLMLQQSLEAGNRLSRAGGPDHLMVLCSEVVSTAYIQDHARALKALSVRRRLILACLKAAEAAQNLETPLGEVLEGVASQAFDLATQGGKTGAVTVGSLLSVAFAKIEACAKGEIVGLKTGLKDLDEVTGGLQPGNYIALGGRPRMGKTSLALDIAAHAAINEKKTVLFFSLEMSSPEIVQRLLCRQGHINVHLLMTGRMAQRDYPKLELARGPVQSAPFYVDDTPGRTPLQIISEARKIRRERGALDLVVVDNIQIMKSDGRFTSKRESISDISNNLKAAAKILNVPLIVISHLSRACDLRDDKRPVLSDLKETGDIEQDADVVMFLYRESVYSDNAEKGLAELIFRKNRNGPEGFKKLTFLEENSSFTNYADPGRYAEPARQRGGFLDD